MELEPGMARVTIEAADPQTARDAAQQLGELWWASDVHGPHPVPGQPHVRASLYAIPRLAAEERAALEAEAPPP